VPAIPAINVRRLRPEEVSGNNIVDSMSRLKDVERPAGKGRGISEEKLTDIWLLFCRLLMTSSEVTWKEKLDALTKATIRTKKLLNGAGLSKPAY
jgi:hypothetical protein